MKSCFLYARMAKGKGPLLLFALLMMAGCGLYGDNPPDSASIAGRVIDTETGEPIPDVVIDTSPITEIVLTANDGSFVINVVNPGIYTV